MRAIHDGEPRPVPWASMTYLFAVLLGLVFGAADQYLGSRSWLYPWNVGISSMSALWLALPFVVGSTQRRDRRAIWLGLLVTLAGLVGYFAMTYSPIEGVPTDRFFSGVVRMATTGYNPLWILGGIVTGPLFGSLGHRWKVSRSRVSAVLLTAAFCLEPLALRAVGMLNAPPRVWVAEIAAGLLVGGVFAVAISMSRLSRQPIPPS